MQEHLHFAYEETGSKKLGDLIEATFPKGYDLQLGLQLEIRSQIRGLMFFLHNAAS